MNLILSSWRLKALIGASALSYSFSKHWPNIQGTNDTETRLEEIHSEDYVNPDGKTGDDHPFRRKMQSANILAVKRTLRTVDTFLRLTFMYKVFSWQNSDLKAKNLDEYKERLAAVHNSAAELVLELCKANGGTFIKLAQHAITLKPDAYVVKLKVLQDRAPTMEFSTVQAILRDELNLDSSMPLVSTSRDESPIFLELDEEPVGSASLAQVHRGLLADGTEVAVKVQRLNLSNIIRSDMILLRWINSLASILFKEEQINFDFAIQELENKLKSELDFMNEAKNLNSLNDLLESWPRLKQFVRLPAVCDEHTTKRVLTMTYIRGTPLRDVNKLKKSQINMSALADSVVESWAWMFFVLGFIHCDPHAGNFLISEDSKLVILDHGQYHRIDESFRKNHCSFWRSMILQDERGIIRSGMELGLSDEICKILPFILLNRTIGSRQPLGLQKEINKSERAAILKEAGLEMLNLQTVADIMEKLPSDFVWILRTMHLIKDLHVHLGGHNRYLFKLLPHFISMQFRRRFQIYAVYAAGIAENPIYDRFRFFWSFYVHELSYFVTRFLSDPLAFCKNLILYYGESRPPDQNSYGITSLMKDSFGF